MKHGQTEQVVDILDKLMPFAKWACITLNIAGSGVLVAALLGWGAIAQTSEGAPWFYHFVIVGALLAGTVLCIERLQFYWIALPVGLLWLPMLLSEKGLITWDYSSFEAGRAVTFLLLLLVGMFCAAGWWRLKR